MTPLHQLHMLKFAALSALNDSSSSDDEESSSADEDEPRKTTKEAQEANAMGIYNKALGHLKEGSDQDAKKLFEELLTIHIIQEAKDEQAETASSPALVLKYSAYKNLASLAAKEEEEDTALEYLLQAVNVDSSDVSVWFKIGKLALKTDHYSLARLAFEQGLECNPSHWPCMDNAITLLYAFGNYMVCLDYISRALSRDAGYTKGLVFMHKMFSEQRSLRNDTIDLFKSCDQSIYSTTLEQEEIDEFINEALDIRKKRSESGSMPPLPVLPLERALTALTWKSLGESLICTYDNVSYQVQNNTASFSEPRVSMGCKIDLSNALQLNTNLPPMDSTPLASTATTNTSLASSPQRSQDEKIVVDTPLAAPEEPAVDREKEVRPFPAKRGPKRKRLIMDDDPFGVKRRSTRVRNTTKKKEECVNYQEMLRKFLPHNLLECDDELDEDFLPVEPLDLTTTQCRIRHDCPDSDSVQKLSESEEEGVHEFIERHQLNSGVVDLITQWLICLARVNNQQWPQGLAAVYNMCYDRLRTHIQFPNFLCRDTTDEFIRDMGHVGLTWLELRLDEWMVHSAPQPSPRSRNSPGGQPMSRDFLGEYFPKDLHYLLTLSVWSDILGDGTHNFSARVFWLRFRFYMLLNDKDMTAESLEKVKEILDDSKEKIYLVNCSVDNLISAEEVSRQEDSLKRCQSLEAVQRLHDNGSYSAVVETLLQTFAHHSLRHRGKDMGAPERHAQLLLLQDSLLKLSDHRRCILWTEVSIHEALYRFLSAPSSEEKEDWISTMIQLFQGIDTCLSEDEDVVSNVPQRHLVRLVHNLMRIIEFSMDVPDGATDMAISNLLPWILLYRLIQHEEVKVRSLQLTADDSCLPSAILLLNMAHDYLGRRGWCTHSDGLLLHFMIKVINQEVIRVQHLEDSFKEDLDTMLEQCFFCLYGHPNKRTKAKHLIEHTSQQVSLTWERSLAVFDFFKPKATPDFDSYKTSTVSGELEHLLKRIASLVPASLDPAINVESIQAYIEESVSDPPHVPEDQERDQPIVTEVFYLLADYYFKNKEQAKAIKFYLQDLCYVPDRFDSWAGMALARASRLEQKLSSHELKPEWPTQKQAICTLRCFKRALQLDGSNAKVRIENGTVAYSLHSHASRLLKHAEMLPLTDEIRSTAQKNVKEMLELAKQCYTKVAPLRSEDEGEDEEDECEERWLQHYMLGKVAEKQREPPAGFLHHYIRGLHYLYEDYAKYPKKITYYYSAPHLAVESLELYYRIHVCACKWLLRNQKEGDEDLLAVYEKYVKLANESPFAKCQEKKATEAERSDTDTEPPKKRSSKPPQDHNYSLHKGSESSEQSSQESKMLEQPHESIETEPPQAKLTLEQSSQESAVFERQPCESTDTELSQTRSVLEQSSQESAVFGCQPCQSTATKPSQAKSVSEQSSQESVVFVPKVKSPEFPKKQGFSVEAILGDVIQRNDQEDMKPVDKNPSLVALDLCIPMKKADGEQTRKENEQEKEKKEEQTNEERKEKSEKMEVERQEEKKEKNDEQENKEEKLDYATRHKNLLNCCIKGFLLCVSRFPQHYKSSYRLAYIYFHSEQFKNLEHCQDLLLGNSKWSELKHMSNPGLFQDRKSTNFFNGLWHIPIEDIDRSGSFPSHLFRALRLLLQVVKEARVVPILLLIHQQMLRTPDPGRKYIRDLERTYLANQAFTCCLEAIEKSIEIERNSDAGDEKSSKFMLQVYKVWQHGAKNALDMQRLNKLLKEAFAVFHMDKVNTEGNLHEQAIKFCQQQLQLMKAPQAPVPEKVPVFPAKSLTEKEESVTLTPSVSKSPSAKPSRSDSAVKSIMASILKEKPPTSTSPAKPSAAKVTVTKPSSSLSQTSATIKSLAKSVVAGIKRSPPPKVPLPAKKRASTPSYNAADIQASMIAAQASMNLSSYDMGALNDLHSQALAQMYTMSLLDPMWAASVAAQNTIYQAQMAEYARASLGSSQKSSSTSKSSTSSASQSQLSKSKPTSTEVRPQASSNTTSLLKTSKPKPTSTESRPQSTTSAASMLKTSKPKPASTETRPQANTSAASSMEKTSKSKTTSTEAWPKTTASPTSIMNTSKPKAASTETRPQATMSVASLLKTSELNAASIETRPSTLSKPSCSASTSSTDQLYKTAKVSSTMTTASNQQRPVSSQPRPLAPLGRPAVSQQKPASSHLPSASVNLKLAQSRHVTTRAERAIPEPIVISPEKSSSALSDHIPPPHPIIVLSSSSSDEE